MTENHDALLQAYKDIAALFDGAGIRHYAAYGTAIGTLRHKGFIPWDDDLDIAIFADDLDRATEVLSKGLDPEKYYYHVPSADSHPHVIIKTPDFDDALRERRVAFIDIFLLLDYPDSAVRRGLMFPSIGFELLSHKIIQNTDSRSIKRMFYWIQDKARKITRMISIPDTRRLCVRFVNIKKNSWERADFGEPIPFPFEDTEIPMPRNYDRILTSYYGDYMTPPPEDQRTGAGSYPYSLLEDYREDMGDGKKHHRLSREDLPL